MAQQESWLKSNLSEIGITNFPSTAARHSEPLLSSSTNCADVDRDGFPQILSSTIPTIPHDLSALAYSSYKESRTE